MKHITTSIILSLSISVAFTAAPTLAESEPINKHTHRMYHGVMSDYFYNTLSLCETGGDWQHNTRSYTSLGIAKGTWKRWSNSDDGRGKTRRYIVKIADNIAYYGHTSDGVYKNNVGPWGWGAIRANCNGLKDMICRSKHPLVKQWQKRC
jgi:hypothetical protein